VGKINRIRKTIPTIN